MEQITEKYKHNKGSSTGVIRKTEVQPELKLVKIMNGNGKDLTLTNGKGKLVMENMK